jgi:hypothetical protein
MTEIDPLSYLMRLRRTPPNLKIRPGLKVNAPVSTQHGSQSLIYPSNWRFGTCQKNQVADQASLNQIFLVEMATHEKSPLNALIEEKLNAVDKSVR